LTTSHFQHRVARCGRARKRAYYGPRRLRTGRSGHAQEASKGATAPSICVFDVNETLLDIEYAAPLFQRLFGDTKVLREWFGQLILYSNAITLSGPYLTFFALGQGVLKMLGSIHGVAVGQADIEELKARMLTMPAHLDVPAGLKLLKDAGSRLVTLTNSPPESRDQSAEPRGHRRVVREILQRRSRSTIQTCSPGLSHGRGGVGRAKHVRPIGHAGTEQVRLHLRQTPVFAIGS
jgi:2-haloalkanoic acid dehalogenase type II